MTDTIIDRAIGAQICAEYLEMPGLRLTIAQAARLFNLEPAYCARLLDGLVKAGMLRTNGRDFLAADSGRKVCVAVDQGAMYISTGAFASMSTR